jgi:hypothetical protein
MKKHYLLNINPQASHEWDRCVLRNPITGERPDLVAAISQAVGQQAGSYLISVTIDVEVLEQAYITSTTVTTREIPTLKTAMASVESKQLLAS